MGRLTTHVLDTATGRPAAGIPISLYRLDGNGQSLLVEAMTNDDGRCDSPILDGGDFVSGRYQLIFHAGRYLTATHLSLHGSPSDLPFLDDVVIAFGINNADQHYHVPLLLSPFGYSTYRGS